MNLDPYKHKNNFNFEKKCLFIVMIKNMKLDVKKNNDFSRTVHIIMQWDGPPRMVHECFPGINLV